jgi:WD40 repeat protein
MPRLWRGSWCRIAIVLLGMPASTAAYAAVSRDGPFLRIETGVHEAAINAVAALPGGVGLVTVSDDKTARVWSPGSLTPIGVIRPPIGPGDIGALYATASSDRVIAVGGRLQDAAGRFGIALYLRADLSSAGTLWGFPAAVTALRFSQSGHLLAVGMQGAGLRVLDLTTGKTAFRDGSFGGTVSGLDFDANDRLVVASDDGMLRLYGADGQPVKLPTLPKAAVPWRAAFSPDGTQLAIGDRHRAVVHLLDMRKLRFDPDLHGAPLTAGALETVAYSPDGKTLFAAGSYTDKTGQMFIRRFTLGAHPAESDIKATRQLVTDLLPRDDGLIFSTADPAIVRVDERGQIAASVTTSHADFRVAGADALLVSHDGSVIDMPGLGGKRLRFDAAAHGITEPDGRPMDRPYAAVRGLGVTQYFNSPIPRLNGQILTLEPAETARSAAVLPDGASAAIGTDFYLRLVGRAGELWRVQTEAPVWAVNASSDGRLVIAAMGDGTVHWYDAASGRELLGLLLDPATQRFVLWTPDGFFDHDHRNDGEPDGRRLIGYRINTPSGRDSNFVEIGQLYPLFFRPDLVGLSLRDDASARRILAQQSQAMGDVAAALGGGLPARVTLLDICPMDAAGCTTPIAFDRARPETDQAVALRTDSDRVRVRYRLDDATSAAGSVTITRNGAVIAADPKITASGAHTRVEEATLSLASGPNRIQFAPISQNGAVEASAAGTAGLLIEHTLPPPPSVATEAEPAPGRMLYVLSVGVGEFEEPDMDIMALRNAADDAQAVADLFSLPSPPVYEKPNIAFLSGKAATRAAITGALRDIAAKARPDDLVILFFAGHGFSVGGSYYYAAADLGHGDSEIVGKLLHPTSDEESASASAALFQHGGLSQDELLPLVQSIVATHVAVILDTCYSADAATSDAVLRRDLNATVANRLGHATGRFVLSSAFHEALDSGGEEMQDHGLFTGYLLKAFQGEADLGHSGIIDVYKLATYMHRAVLGRSADMAKQYSKDTLRQEPSFYFAGNDFFELLAVRPPPPTH